MLLLFVLGLCPSHTTQASVTYTWNAPGGGWWHEAYPNNWTPAGPPQYPGHAALVTEGPMFWGTIHLGMNPTIDWLDIQDPGLIFELHSGVLTTSEGFTNPGLIKAYDGTATINGPLNNLSPGIIRIRGYNTGLNLGGPAFVNDGSVIVNYESAWSAILTCTGDVSLSGGGEVMLNHAGSDAQLNTTGGATLTQAAGHTIHGRGQINAALVNDGVVLADATGDANALRLETNPKTNNGVMQAGPGTYLDVYGIAITQSPGGQVVADGAGAVVRLRGGATISGGSFVSLNGGALQVWDGSNTLDDVTLPSGTWLGVRGYDRQLHLTGSALNNYGTLVVNFDQAWSSILAVDESLTLQGSGEVVLNQGGDTYNARLNTAGGVTLTQAAGHTIRGRGQINAALVNDGVVMADVAGDANALRLETNPKTNNSVTKAGPGAYLDLYGIAVTQPPTGQVVADGAGSGVRLRGGATISGGTLASVNGGALFSWDGSNTLRDVTLASGTWLGVRGYSRQLHLAGSTITNHGTLVVNTEAAWDSTLAVDETLTLQGGGEVVLNAAGSDARLNTSAGVTLTQAGGHTIRGRGQINAALVNAGTVVADVTNQTLYVQTNAKTNHGAMKAANAGALQVSVDVDGTGGWTADGGTVNFGSGVDALTAGPIAINNNGLLQLSSANLTGSDLTMDTTGRLNVAGTISLSGDLDFAMTEESRMVWNTGATLTMTGGIAGGGCNDAFWAKLEAGGYDFADGQPHQNNFDLRTLTIGNDAAVALVDYRDNGNRNGPGGPTEAVYVAALTLGSGATLNLNGLHFYVNGLPVSPGPYGGGAVIDQHFTHVGDVNLDGQVTLDDIGPFVGVLTGSITDPGAVCAADVDGSGTADGLDIQPFVNLLLAP